MFSATKNILLVFLFLISGNSFSNNMYGSGVGSCGEWLQERKGNDWYNKGQWMLGFVSAAGYYANYTLKNTDSKAFVAWMDNYCHAHPLEDFSTGVKSLVEELRTVPSKK